MIWDKKKFSALYLIPSKNGISKSADRHSDGVKIVNMGEIFAYNYISSQEMRRLSLSKDEIEKYIVNNDDLLFARRSLIESGAGKVSIIKNPDEDTVFESSIIRVRLDKSLCIPHFYYYWLSSPNGRATISSIVCGTNVKGIRGSDLKNIDIPYPNMDIQRKIVSILYYYDTLIENNQRQIKLLEEAAQRLYKEWFVDFHFPGHENVKMIDSVPKGWNWFKIEDIAKFQRGKVITKNDIVNGNVPVVAGGLNPAYYTNKWNAEGPVITISSSGANAGYINQYYSRIWASDCSYLEKQSSVAYYYVYQFLKMNQSMIMTNLQKGSAQPHVYAKDINALDILTPMDDLLTLYTEFTEKIYALIEMLKKSILYLIEARNRLLPKLMNGEIEVTP